MKRYHHRSTLSLLLLATFVLHIGFSFSFMHTHALADGRIIHHSHPLQADQHTRPSHASHSHTNAQFLFYFSSTVLSFMALLFFLLEQPPLAFATPLICSRYELFDQFTAGLCSRRAPPSAIL